MKTVPIEELLERLEVRDGALFWKKPLSRRLKIGQRAGSMGNKGYRKIRFVTTLMVEHRVIFAMTHGRWPVAKIDHINGDRSDNRPENLREATNAENLCNRSMTLGNTSGRKGVTWDKNRRKWVAQIGVNGGRIHLGGHDDLDLAAFIYECAAIKYHGEFARA